MVDITTTTTTTTTATTITTTVLRPLDFVLDYLCQPVPGR